jgi:hypothetical protein
MFITITIVCIISFMPGLTLELFLQCSIFCFSFYSNVTWQWWPQFEVD